MAIPPAHFCLTMAKEVILAASHLPCGVVAGAVAERACRRLSSRHPRARLRNTAATLALAHASVSWILGRDVFRGPWSAGPRDGTVLFWTAAAARLLAFAAGTAVGAALQPVGLTGGIATGKSSAARLLRSPPEKEEEEDDDGIEFVVIDVDGIAHDVLRPGTDGSVYDRVVAAFGTDILATTDDDDGDGGDARPIDRRKLGDVVFRDARKRRRLNAITHPRITRIMLRRILTAGLDLGRWCSAPGRGRGRPRPTRRVVCVDVPLLFEAGIPMRALFGTVVVVACDPANQLDRLRKRDPDLGLAMCRQRIASQIPVEAKARMADWVLRNDGSREEFARQVARARRDLADAVAGPARGVASLSAAVLGLGAAACLLSAR